MATYRCRISPVEAATATLRRLDAEGVVAADHVVVRGDSVQVILNDNELAAVEASGLRVERGPALVARHLRRDAGAPGVPQTDITSGFVTGYMDTAEIVARIVSIAAAFPAWCSVIDLPTPTAGYDGSLASAAGPAIVRCLRITADPADHSRPGFLVFGGTHAREWMNPLIALEFAEQLLHNVNPASGDPAVQAITRIVTEGDIFVVPVMNPDGLTYSVHDDAGWRKNRRPNAGSPGCPGVDLNRNYEVYWGGAGSSAVACSEAFHGPSAFSEAETQNIRYLLEQYPNIVAGVDLHSFGLQILRPGPGGGSYISSLPVSAADDAVYSELEATLGAAIQSGTVSIYSTGSTSNHAGTSDEYMFFAHRVFGFNTECGLDFQPPWSEVPPVVAEVVTGLRALALATIDLTTTTTTPLAVVQCIDRTGSMVASGYDAAARDNARRFADLLSLGDSTAVISFADPATNPNATPLADRSKLELPLTLLDDPGDAATVRAAIDAIQFGGWTPIGAGLIRSRDILATCPAPRAVLLLSDGYENRAPASAGVLSTWPANLPVFTIALGPAADTALLQQIATSTGGVFQLSPSALDLYLVYNQMRADIADCGLLLNETLAATGQVADRVIQLEPAVDSLVVSLACPGAEPPQLALVAPSGRTVSAGDHGVRVVRSGGYTLLTKDRPQPGQWCVRVGESHPGHARVLAAFASSPLRVDLRLPERVAIGQTAQVEAALSFDGRPIQAPSVLARSRAIRLPEAGRPVPGSEPGWEHPASVHERRAASGRTLVIPIAAEARLGGASRWTKRPVLPPAPCSRIELRIAGHLPGGAPFQRVAMRTIAANA